MNLLVKDFLNVQMMNKKRIETVKMDRYPRRMTSSNKK